MSSDDLKAKLYVFCAAGAEECLFRNMNIKTQTLEKNTNVIFFFWITKKSCFRFVMLLLTTTHRCGCSCPYHSPVASKSTRHENEIYLNCTEEKNNKPSTRVDLFVQWSHKGWTQWIPKCRRPICRDFKIFFRLYQSPTEYYKLILYRPSVNILNICAKR